VIAEAGEGEEVIYADVGKCRNHEDGFRPSYMISTDPQVLESARSGIPVTTQRRFDVYQDVAKGA
jgi:omega-amidase